MWRRVPCEQPLHTGQSILSPRRNPMLMVAGCFDRRGSEPVSCFNLTRHAGPFLSFYTRISFSSFLSSAGHDAERYTSRAF
jgi:hypothetical protein